MTLNELKADLLADGIIDALYEEELKKQNQFFKPALAGFLF